MKAIDDYEEHTKTNFVVLEKKKHFGNLELWPPANSKLYWQGPLINNVSIYTPNGIPFFVAGRKVLTCHLGKDMAVLKKKKICSYKRCKTG
ncbi:hypothetical protein GDO86_003035 [Hymenochirus boettgeri]|uniref:Uncharacterized protein n=1 Tax=Hymenochirus boettgeri TaxID=247094 RepID=A0A8T2K7U9_9PIPI|nr:hypothetical protein GDO86_003035 [Hymenochirus boettgeri]